MCVCVCVCVLGGGDYKTLPDTESLFQIWVRVGFVCVCARVCCKSRDFIGKWCPDREQEGKGTRENCSATRPSVSGFMVMALVSRLSLANHSDSEFFLVVHVLFSQDGC